MYKFTIIGIDDNPLSVERNLHFVQDELRRAKVFSGGKRHFELVKEYLPDSCTWIDITVPLDNVFARYEEIAGENSAPVEQCNCLNGLGVDGENGGGADAAGGEPGIVVFASGDPLFYGFAATIQRRLPQARIKVYPVFNSLQSLAHRLALPYEDMMVVSLTGRPWHQFDQALIGRCRKLGILTDKVHTPAAIAARALHYGYRNYRMHVGEALGGEREKVTTLMLQEAVHMEFDTPNCVILTRENGQGEFEEQHRRLFGIPHSNFSLLDGRENMITKMPIRLLSLSMLDLHNRTALWDIGFCTGSVSIEAKMQFPHLYVDSFEVREQCAAIMEENCRKTGVPGIEAHIGDFTKLDLPKMLKNRELHLPDSIVIGGHGGKIALIMKMLSEIVESGCIVVYNSVRDWVPFEEAALANGFTHAEKTEITIDSYNKITCCKVVKI
jgi:precorrin-6Y C5,15-methyltransferase (decarboxylating)